MSNHEHRLLEIYRALLTHYGPQRWWPADNPTEMIIGAILVQHTAWSQVPPAIAALRRRRLLDFKRLANQPAAALAEPIRPAGTPMVKARRLQAFADWLGSTTGFDVQAALNRPVETLREQLLAIKGIGPETADCILLYAAKRPSFVVDRSARRVFTRHLLMAPDEPSDRVKRWLESNLPEEVPLYNEYHALLVQVGKEHCRAVPRCHQCPLEHLEHCADRSPWR